MTINLQKPDVTELKPRITVYGVGGGGGNAVNNMIAGGLEGVEFVVANTDAQALMMSKAERVVQMGVDVTEGLGAGSQPDVGRAAAEECLTEITDHLNGSHMTFVTAGMGGGTGTGAAPVVARAAREMGILTVGVVTKPFHFEGQRRMRTADAGIEELQKNVDTLIVIPNQNLFRIANDKTTFADAFGMADQVLYSGVACITDLMVKEGLINLDFADVRSVMNAMGKAMMGTGEASGDGRAIQAAEAAISNPLLDESSMLGAQGLLISITGGRDMTLFEVDEAATRIREEVDSDANIILGATFDEDLEGTIRVSVVATGIDNASQSGTTTPEKPKLTALGGGSLATASAIANGLEIPTAKMAPETEAGTESSLAKIENAASAIATNANALATKPSASMEKNGVRIEPFQPQSTVFSDSASEEEFRNALEEELMPSGEDFVPPTALRVEESTTASTIPNVGEFPAIAQAEIEAKSKPEPKPKNPVDDRGPMGLLKKLKSGFGIQEEKPAIAKPAATMKPNSPTPQAPIAKPAAPIASTIPAPAPLVATTPPVQVTAPMGNATDASATSAPVQSAQAAENPFAPNQNSLDQNGRITTDKNPTSDDDQLDIPAFLRRQSN